MTAEPTPQSDPLFKQWVKLTVYFGAIGTILFATCLGVFAFLFFSEEVTAAGNSPDGRWNCVVYDRRAFVDTNLRIVLTERDGMAFREEFRSPDVSPGLAKTIDVSWDADHAAFIIRGKLRGEPSAEVGITDTQGPVVAYFCTCERKFFPVWPTDADGEDVSLRCEQGCHEDVNE